MYVLGIETSCDETCAAVVRHPARVLSNVVASSLALHAPHGGVIPEIASRAHLEAIVAVVDASLKRAKIGLEDLSLVAVTRGPGLVGSLLVGISFARALALSRGLPLIGIDHLKAHLYAAFIDQAVSYPFVGLVVSGGHTSLYRVTHLGREETLGATRDDAAGEAFDKVAKILGLGYPGGPAIEKMAGSGHPAAYPLCCDCGDGLDFSFSGIKTAVLYRVRDLRRTLGCPDGKLPRRVIADLCAAFQETVVADLVQKSVRAVRRTGARLLVVGGGVAFNGRLRTRLQEAAQKEHFRLYLAGREYCLDNGAMVASLAGRLYAAGRRVSLKLDPLLG